MSFHDVVFPEAIARGSTGGPEYRTQILLLSGGDEDRKQVWSAPLHSYDAGVAISTVEELSVVLRFFHARAGRFHTFRFKDWADYRSCDATVPIKPTDQVLGEGDGSRLTFQLVKVYGDAEASYTRVITKPRAGTVRLGLNGAETSAFSVNTTTGVVTLDEPPGAGVLVTAGYEFDVHARFASDKLGISMRAFSAGEIPDVPIMEVRR